MNSLIAKPFFGVSFPPVFLPVLPFSLNLFVHEKGGLPYMPDHLIIREFYSTGYRIHCWFFNLLTNWWSWFAFFIFHMQFLALATSLIQIRETNPTIAAVIFWFKYYFFIRNNYPLKVSILLLFCSVVNSAVFTQPFLKFGATNRRLEISHGGITRDGGIEMQAVYKSSLTK